MLDITHGINLRPHQESVWDEQWRVDKLKILWAGDDHSAAAIGLILGVSRMAVIGKARRLGLISRKQHTMPIGKRLLQQREAARRWREKASGPLAFIKRERPPKVGGLAFIKRERALEVPSIIDDEIPLDQRCALLELDRNKCHWPVGEPDQPGFFFCGSEDKRNGSSYCRAHHAVAYPPRDVVRA